MCNYSTTGRGFLCAENFYVFYEVRVFMCVFVLSGRLCFSHFLNAKHYISFLVMLATQGGIFFTFFFRIVCHL